MEPYHKELVLVVGVNQENANLMHISTQAVFALLSDNEFELCGSLQHKVSVPSWLIIGPLHYYPVLALIQTHLNTHFCAFLAVSSLIPSLLGFISEEWDTFSTSSFSEPNGDTFWPD